MFFLSLRKSTQVNCLVILFVERRDFGRVFIACISGYPFSASRSESVWEAWIGHALTVKQSLVKTEKCTAGTHVC